MQSHSNNSIQQRTTFQVQELTQAACANNIYTPKCSVDEGTFRKQTITCWKKIFNRVISSCHSKCNVIQIVNLITLNGAVKHPSTLEQYHYISWFWSNTLVFHSNIIHEYIMSNKILTSKGFNFPLQRQSYSINVFVQCKWKTSTLSITGERQWPHKL